MGELIPTSSRQFWIKTADSPVAYSQMTELVDLSYNFDKQTYERKYKDKLTTSEVITGVKYGLEVEVELEDDATGFHAYIMENEEVLNVATELIVVDTTKPATEPLVGYEAKKAAFVMTVDPIDGEAGEYLHAMVTFSRTDDAWTLGTFDPDTATFTAAT